MKIPAEWTFESGEIAAGFDEHVREQLPWYDLATKAIVHVGRHYIPRGGLVYDIGASTGNVGRALAGVLESRDASLIALENSSAMIPKYRGPGTLIEADATSYAFKPFDLAVCFLVLMFIAPKDRAAVLTSLRASLLPGGALIIFDKCLPAFGYPAVVMSRLAMAGKIENGADPRDVIDKELSLAGIQRPLDPAEIGDGIEFFRFGDFRGWIIEATRQPRLFAEPQAKPKQESA